MSCIKIAEEPNPEYRTTGVARTISIAATCWCLESKPRCRSAALALTFAQAVAPVEVEEHNDDEEIIGGHGGINGPGSCMQ